VRLAVAAEGDLDAGLQQLISAHDAIAQVPLRRGARTDKGLRLAQQLDLVCSR
jgi:hypothetical protein